MINTFSQFFTTLFSTDLTTFFYIAVLFILSLILIFK